MGKMRKRAAAAVMGVFISLAAAGAVFAEETEIQSEQTIQEENLESVYLNLPEVFVYGNLPDRTNETVEGYLGQERLEFVQNQVFEDTGETIYYYVLLDISGSIPKKHFSEIKDEILEFQRNLRKQDRLILYSFGEEVRLLCDGSQTDGELELVLSELSNNDQETLLFEAMSQAGEHASAVTAEECRRKVMVVFSDGEDIAVGKTMSQEAQSDLQQKGIPVYAMCIEETDRNNINSFGEFSRMTGGNLTLIKQGETAGTLDELQRNLLSMNRLEFQARNNLVSNAMTTFLLRASDSDKTMSKQVMNARWIPDTAEPEIVETVQAGDRQIQIRFSEPVIGLENVSNYMVSLDGKLAGVSGIMVSGENSDAVVLTLTEDFQTGEYKISCTEIADCSMEKNPVKNAGFLYVETEEKKTPSDYRTLLFLLVAAIVVLCIVILAKVGKRKAEDLSELDFDSISQEKDFDEKKDEIMLSIEIREKGEQPVKLQWPIKTVLTAGRREPCNILLKNPRVSKEHFRLERDGNEIWITDLNSTNGTRVNETRLEANVRTKLNSGDVVKAGPMEMILTWR